MNRGFGHLPGVITTIAFCELSRPVAEGRRIASNEFWK
jgi:hypothetical protein